MKDAFKNNIKVGAVNKIVLKVADDVTVYSIKFSNARDIYYDNDYKTVCVYGDTSTGTAPLDSFVAISAEYNGERFVDAQIKDVYKDQMTEWSLPMTNGNTFKLFMWKDLDLISPIALPYIFE